MMMARKWRRLALGAMKITAKTGKSECLELLAGLNLAPAVLADDQAPHFLQALGALRARLAGKLAAVITLLKRVILPAASFANQHIT